MFPSPGLGSGDHLRDRLAHRAPRISAPTFHCAIHPQAERAVLAPTGELDIDTAPLLDSALRDLRDVGFETLVVDLRGLTFIDSQGVQLLLRWSITAARRGHAFRLVPGPERVQMVFAMTGLLEHLQFERVQRAA